MYAGVPSTLPSRVGGVATSTPPGVSAAAVSRLRITVPPSLGDISANLALAGRLFTGEDLGEAPVHDLDLAELADHDVRRLQVPVDDP